MVMGREQGLGTEISAVADVLDDSPGDAHPVKGGCAAADLIQDQEAFGSRVAEDIGDLVHLHHEGTLAAPQIVRGSHPGKDPVGHTQPGLVRGDKASDLRHQDDQGDLTHIGGFTRHIGAGDNTDTVVFVVKQSVIGDKVAALHLFHDRVSAGCYPDGSGLIEGWPHVVVSLRHEGQGGKGIEMSQGFCRFLEIRDAGGAGFPDTAEGVVFQGVQLVLCVEDAVLQLLELLGRVPLGAHQRLFADIVLRDQVFEGIGDLKIIAENFVVLDAQVFDPGAFPVLGLQIHQPLPAVIAGISQVVDILIKAGTDHPALTDRDRGLIDQGVLQKFQKLAKISDPVVQKGKTCGFFRRRGGRGVFDAGSCFCGSCGGCCICRGCCRGCCRGSPGGSCKRCRGKSRICSLLSGVQCPADVLKDIFDGDKHPEGISEGDQVPGICGLVGDPGHQTLKVIDRAQIFAQFIAVHAHGAQRLDTVQSLFNLLPAGEGLLQKTVQKPCSHCRTGLVKDPKQGPSLLFVPQRLREFKVPAGRAVQQHIFAGSVGADPGEIGKTVFLCIIEIAQQSSGGQSSRRKILDPQGEEGGGPEMLQQELYGRGFFKEAGVDGTDLEGKTAAQVPQIEPAHEKSVIAQELRGAVADDLVVELDSIRHLGDEKVAGGDIRGGDPDLPAGIKCAQDVVVFSFLQGVHVEVCTGSDDPDDLPAHDAFCRAWILHLFTDGDLVAVFHQPGQIAVDGVIGHPAHGCALGETAALAGQGQLQFAGHSDRVIKKHLIKIPQPVKKQAVGIIVFGAQIMLHHRRELLHELGILRHDGGGGILGIIVQIFHSKSLLLQNSC